MHTAAARLSLCLILTLSMAGSGSPALAPRSPASSSWWDQASIPIQEKALRLRRSGDFGAAEQLYRQGYDEAVRLGDKLAQVRFLISVGGCQFGQYGYQAALSTFLQARELATAIGDREDLAGIAGNLSSLYQQVWDMPAALQTAVEGLAEISTSNTRGTRHSYYEAPLRLQLGRLHAVSGDSRALQDYADSIEAARAQTGAEATEALGWDLLGERELTTNDLDGAEKAFLEAYRLRLLFRHAEIGYSEGRLGGLELARGRPRTALQLTERALAAARRGGLAQPEYILLHQRGRVRMALEQTAAALNDFSAAVDATARWRMEVPAARSALTGANSGLDEQIFRSFVEAAAAQAWRTQSRAWAEKAFQALELNRTASLRESLALAETWHNNLPPQYWEVLGQITAEEGRSLHQRPSIARIARLYLNLTEMEAEVGRGMTPKISENFRSQSSLNHFRNGIRDTELFLSFWLGTKESYLWAINRESLRLYRLPAASEITEAVQAFRKALPGSAPEAAEEGRRLYAMLFGQLTAAETGKPAWLLSQEGALFDIPFAALVSGEKDGKPVYLVESHSLQTVPGAMLLAGSGRRSAQEPGGRFRGVGDPVYNTADSRWRGPVSPRADGQLDRLVGSGTEVETSAHSWSTGTQSSWQLLRGPQASRKRLLRELATQPSVIHLATHVLLSPQKREQGLLALSLAHGRDQYPQPEYLSASEIAALRVPGAMIVMTGCATGAGTPLMGAGLLGLTQAWLMAGASTVVATGWPVEDTTGEFFARFYSHLREQSPAEALRSTQIEEIGAGSWRRAPLHWASYRVTGGVH